MGFEETLTSHNQLLPGIPDDVTLGQIMPKLPWRDCHVLSSVSRSWQEAIQSHLVYGDKLVLTFERNGSPRLAKTWIAEFNETSLHKLCYNDELVDQIFVVSIVSEAPDVSKSALLSCSPLLALEVLASVNLFFPGFNPRSLVKDGTLSHRLAGVIKQGGQFVFDALNYALQPVGHMISFGLGPDRLSVVTLIDYLGLPPLRCERCRSNDHEDCEREIESLFM